MVFIDGAAGVPDISVDLSVQANVLLSLKTSLIDKFGRLDTWSSDNSTSPCSWTGVTCNATQQIVALDLSHMNLSGTLSPHISLLPHLVNLSVAANNLSGSLPTEISHLSSLRYLNISNNVFSNAFPKNFSHLNYLEVLDAFNNNFTGELPLEISQLMNLKHLHLGGSFFAGSIHPQYGNIQSLEYLALSGNALTGRIPPELANLANLQYMYIGYFNQYDGGIPVEFGRLTNLIRLDIANSGLTGTIPASLGSLTNLDSIFLLTNSLVGSIPPELGNLTNLKSLDLSNNHLSGTIPDELRHCQKLELIMLFLNFFHGNIPSYIGDLPHLQVLDLWENNFTGIVPQQLGRNGQLLEVDLSTNSLTGPIPPDLCFGNKLQRLVLLSNGFSGSIPAGLGNCSTLNRIRLGNNLLSGSIPSGLLSLPVLDLLQLPFNRLTGPLPTNIPFSPSIGALILSNNQLNGSLPSSIGNMSLLVDLDLSGNRFSGAIPSTIGNLKRLSKLQLNDNRFTGAIPAALSECVVLTSLDLSRNELDGEIPTQISKLNVLETLNVSRNFLTGSIPPSLEDMVTLTVVDVSYNNLTGEVPDHGQFASFNSSSFAGNRGLCGKQLSVVCRGNASQSSKDVSKRSNKAGKYWYIGLVCLVVLTMGSLYFCLRDKKGFRQLLRTRRWKLTAFERLDFTKSNVLNCLSDENIIGKGGAGTVYKGLMPNGQMVAVKRLPGCCMGSTEGDYGFSAEMQTLGKIRHRYIVRLLGCCSNRETNLLLYEYMPNGSLGELLHGPRGGSLNWANRYRIAVEAAKGLCYLHHDCCPSIVHRDVKSNNILLDSNYEAHVADFGLARALQASGTSESMSSVAGSYGYIAPEYAYTLKVGEKSDIYSYGVVLLELLTGRRPVEPEYGDCVDIAKWVRKKAQTREGTLEIIDKRMGVAEGTKQMHEAMRLLKVALLCLVEPPHERPTLREVVQMLTDIPKVNESSKCTGFASANSPPDLISI